MPARDASVPHRRALAVGLLAAWLERGTLTTMTAMTNAERARLARLRKVAAVRGWVTHRHATRTADRAEFGKFQLSVQADRCYFGHIEERGELDTMTLDDVEAFLAAWPARQLPRRAHAEPPGRAP